LDCLFTFGWTRIVAVELGILRDLRRVVKRQVANLRRAQDEQLGNLPRLRFDARGIDEQHFAERMAGGRGHFGG